MKLRNFFKKSLKDNIEEIIVQGKDRESLFEEIEEQLILADISGALSEKILNGARSKLKSKFSKEEFFGILRDEIRSIFDNIGKENGLPDSLLPLSKLKIEEKGEPSERKEVILLIGVNGSGKTTTAAKLGFRYKNEGRKVLFAATDTFRAAGSSQLEKWGERIGVPVISDEKGADPGSVLFNALNSFVSKDYDILIVDTAGRVQTRENLMRELEKMVKIVKRFVPEGPSEIFLVIDATMGQNTVDQAEKFRKAAGISGIILSKIDGTAKGGTILRIADELGIRVKFVGTGETEKDLEEFSGDDFVNALLGFGEN